MFQVPNQVTVHFARLTLVPNFFARSVGDGYTARCQHLPHPGRQSLPNVFTLGPDPAPYQLASAAAAPTLLGDSTISSAWRVCRAQAKGWGQNEGKGHVIILLSNNTKTDSNILFGKLKNARHHSPLLVLSKSRFFFEGDQGGTLGAVPPSTLGWVRGEGWLSACWESVHGGGGGDKPDH